MFCRISIPFDSRSTINSKWLTLMILYLFHIDPSVLFHIDFSVYKSYSMVIQNIMLSPCSFLKREKGILLAFLTFYCPIALNKIPFVHYLV